MASCYPACVAQVQILERYRRKSIPAILPVRDAEPVVLHIVGEDEARPHYLIEFSAMAREQQQQIVDVLSAHYGTDPDAVRADLTAKGLPMRADWCRLLVN